MISAITNKIPRQAESGAKVLDTHCINMASVIIEDGSLESSSTPISSEQDTLIPFKNQIPKLVASGANSHCPKQESDLISSKVMDCIDNASCCLVEVKQGKVSSAELVSSNPFGVLMQSKEFDIMSNSDMDQGYQSNMKDAPLVLCEEGLSCESEFDSECDSPHISSLSKKIISEAGKSFPPKKAKKKSHKKKKRPKKG